MLSDDATRSVNLAALLAALLSMALSAEAQVDDPELSLPEAVRQALESNLDLIAQRRALDSARAEIGLARAPLLPQADFGARAQLLDAERSDEARGNNREGSFLIGAGVSQVVYDEKSWADFTIRKHDYDGRVKQLESSELAVIESGATAFLEVNRSQRALEIQLRNRELTVENIEKSRARIAAGWSSEREVLRWETQLARNDADVRTAQVRVLQSRMELNRVRNRPPEADLAASPPSLEEYGFVYADETIATAVQTSELDRRMRDFLVRLGIGRSPDLAAIDASIAAAERQLTANKRSFWVPTLSVNAGVDYLANHSEDSGFNQSEWVLKGLLSYPIARGGARFAGLDRARASLESLRTDRRATALSLEERIRADFAKASGAYENVGFVGRQEAAAKRNFDLVEQSYTLGVASILDLLDAQAQLLTAELALNDANYGFLADLVAAERTISFYAFLEPRDDVEALLAPLADELQRAP
jgi:outer membrane protein TolC